MTEYVFFNEFGGKGGFYVIEAKNLNLALDEAEKNTSWQTYMGTLDEFKIITEEILGGAK